MNSPGAVEYLKNKIRDYEDGLSKIRAEIATLESESTRIQGLIKSASALLKEELGQRDVVENPTPAEEFLARLGTMSISDAIEAIVYKAQKPIHADEILRQLKQAGIIFEAKSPKNSVVSLLHRGIKAGMYVKVGPNLFTIPNMLGLDMFNKNEEAN